MWLQLPLRASAGEGLPLRDVADAGCACGCSLCFLRQILGMRVRCDWMRTGRFRHGGGRVRNQGVGLGWRPMGGQGSCRRGESVLVRSMGWRRRMSTLEGEWQGAFVQSSWQNVWGFLGLK